MSGSNSSWEHSNPIRPWRRPLRFLILLPLFLAGAWATSSYYYANQFLHPPAKQCVVEEYLFCSPPEKVWKGSVYTKLSGGGMAGWYVRPKDADSGPAQEKPIVVFYHGHGHDRRQAYRPAWFFYKASHPLMIMDRTGHGENIAERTSDIDNGPAVFTTCSDLKKWHSWAVQKSAKVWLYAFSSGSTQALECNPGFARIILDSPLPGYEYWFRRWIKSTSNLPEELVYRGMRWWLEILAGFDPGVLHKQSKKPGGSTPVLVLHGQDDTFVPPAAVQKLFKELKGPKRRLLVPGGHARLWRPGQAHPKLEAAVFNAAQ